MIGYRQNVFPVRPYTSTPKPEEDHRPMHAKLLSWITAAAEKGERCPTGSQIADRFGIPTDAIAMSLFGPLERDGSIKVFRTRNMRVVLVTATGKHTKPPTRNKDWGAWLAEHRSAAE